MAENQENQNIAEEKKEEHEIIDENSEISQNNLNIEEDIHPITSEPISSDQNSIKQESLPSSELHDPCLELKEELKIKSDRLNEMESEIQNLIREIETNKNTIEEISEIRSQNHHLNEQNSQLTNQINELQNEFSIHQSESKILHHKVDELESEIDQKNQTIEEFRSKANLCDDFEIKNTEYSHDIEHLKTEKQDLEQKINSMIMVMEEKSDKIRTLEEKNQTLDHEKENLQMDKTNLDHRILELNEELESKKHEYMQLREELNRKTNEELPALGAMTNQLMEKDVLIDDLKQEVRDLNEKIEKMVFRDELEKLKAEFDSQVKQTHSLEEKIQQQEDLLNAKDEQINSELGKVELKNQELQDLLHENHKIHEIMNEKEETIKDFEKQEEEFHEALMETLRVTAEKDELNTKISELIEQKTVLYDRINELKNNDRGHIAIIKRLEKKIEDLEKLVKEKEQIPLEDIRETIEKQILKERIEELNHELRDQIIKASESVGKYEITKDMVDQLQHQLKDITNKYDLIKQDFQSAERKYIEEKEVLNSLLKQKQDILAPLQEQVTELQLKLDEASEAAEFKDEIGTLKRDLEEQSGIAESLADDVSKANIEIMMGKKEIERLNEEIVNLKRRIKLLRRDLSQQQ